MNREYIKSLLIFKHTILIFFILNSCSYKLYNNQIEGRYVSGTEYSDMKILIARNGSIEIIRIVPNRCDTCKGAWKSISSDQIVVSCQDIKEYSGDVKDLLAPPFIITEDTIKIISSSKFKFRKQIFKRRNENNSKPAQRSN